MPPIDNEQFISMIRQANPELTMSLEDVQTEIIHLWNILVGNNR
jgi:hypothetical protein